MRHSRQIARLASVAAVAAAAIVAAVLLLGDGAGDGYTVKARFQNASQLVKGNLVQVSGEKVGSVEDIRLTDEGHAEVTLVLDEAWRPLRHGTEVVVRQTSLSGIANRYLDLRLGPHGAPPIAEGGVIGTEHTTTAVDLDQLFNTFDAETRRGLTKLVRGFGRQYAGRSRDINEGLLYLNPSLSASSRLFRELNRDSELLERFIVGSSRLVTDIADRRDDLAGAVDNLATTMNAVGDEQVALQRSLELLPAFMRRANTTFVNLRATLDDLDPLVEDSKPVARKLRPLLAELRPLARDARPTLRDLSRLIRRAGEGNDLVELTRAQPRLRDIAVGPVRENGEERQGALPASTDALRGATPELGYARPYAPDLIGWFDDFSHSGVYDALGGVSRVGVHANAFMLVGSQFTPIPPELRDDVFRAVAETQQMNRCPGAGEHTADDGSNPLKPSPDHDCDESQRLPGE